MPVTTDSSKEWLLQQIESSKNSPAYGNYLEIRDFVLRIMDANPHQDASLYWQEELAGFDYFLDASPLLVNKLRHQCYHLTGIRDYEYRNHHREKAQEAFHNKLAALRRFDPEGRLLVGESPELGGFGFQIDDFLINLDTLKFYEVLIGLDRAGLLAPFSRPVGETSERKAILEIGAGWGGFAYQFKTLYPQSPYLIVDLPQTLLFSGTYLKTLFPECRFLLVDEAQPTIDKSMLEEFDFILIPHYVWPHLQMEQLDLAINMISFQEMTSGQVEDYVARLSGWGCPNLYSLNRDVSSHNTELSSVSGIMARYYDLKPVEILDVAYTELKVPVKKESQPDSRSWVKWLRTALSAKQRKKIKAQAQKRQEKERFLYRHLAGSLKAPC